MSDVHDRARQGLSAAGDLRPGDSHAPLTTLVLVELRNRILRGDLSAGERLVEGRLSEELGVSRVPVREALRALASEGLVTIEPRRGAVVTRYTEEQIMEIVEVRATLEGLNAKLAARRHDPAQIARLQRILAEGAELTADDDLTRIAELNSAFHDALGDVSSNSVLRDMMRSLRDRTALLFASNDPESIRRNWQEHAAVLQAVIAGDQELAALLASRHVHRAAGGSSTPNTASS